MMSFYFKRRRGQQLELPPGCWYLPSREAAGSVGDSFERWMIRKRSVRLKWWVGCGVGQDNVAKLKHLMSVRTSQEHFSFHLKQFASLSGD
jgi:hypothetical protein